MQKDYKEVDNDYNKTEWIQTHNKRFRPTQEDTLNDTNWVKRTTEQPLAQNRPKEIKDDYSANNTATEMQTNYRDNFDCKDAKWIQWDAKSLRRHLYQLCLSSVSGWGRRYLSEHWGLPHCVRACLGWSSSCWKSDCLYWMREPGDSISWGLYCPQSVSTGERQVPAHRAHMFAVIQNRFNLRA